MSSSRLPGKVLRPILGRPMILYQVERILDAKKIDLLVVATSTDASDDCLYQVCRAAGIRCERGSLEDVLDRFHQVAARFAPDQVIRLTADCPLMDPEILDATIAFHVKHDFDYTSNTLDGPTFPHGLDAEVIRFESLKRAWREARLPSEREHVTPYFYQHRNLFRVGVYRGGRDLSGYRWTVDEPEDLELVRRIYEALYPVKPGFRMADVLALWEREPGLALINSRFKRNEAFAKSLARDREFLDGSPAL